MTPVRVLTIAGSDSGGSAGIQADLKTFEAREVFGTSALTIATAQNTVGVQQAFPMSVEFILAQIKSVMEDIQPRAIKTGLLGRAEVIKAVTDYFLAIDLKMPLVVDPVLVDGSGNRIVSEAAMQAYREILFPLATVITPNLDEACWLADMAAIATETQISEAVQRLHNLSGGAVLLKGGHLGSRDTMRDFFYDGWSMTVMEAETLPFKNPHGVGCTFAAAITAELAKENTTLEAVQIAHRYLQAALRGALNWQVGQGRSPVNHQAGRKI